MISSFEKERVIIIMRNNTDNEKKADGGYDNYRDNDVDADKIVIMMMIAINILELMMITIMMMIAINILGLMMMTIMMMIKINIVGVMVITVLMISGNL